MRQAESPNEQLLVEEEVKGWQGGNGVIKARESAETGVGSPAFELFHSRVEMVAKPSPALSPVSYDIK